MLVRVLNLNVTNCMTIRFFVLWLFILLILFGPYYLISSV